VNVSSAEGKPLVDLPHHPPFSPVFKRHATRKLLLVPLALRSLLLAISNALLLEEYVSSLVGAIGRAFTGSATFHETTIRIIVNAANVPEPGGKLPARSLL